MSGKVKGKGSCKEMTEEQVRPFIGKIVALKWKDPADKQQMMAHALDGEAGLATWMEWVKIDSVKENVIRYLHGEAISPGDTEPDEANYGYVHVALVRSVIRLLPSLTERVTDEEIEETEEEDEDDSM